MTMPGVEAASVGINLPADYFLSEEYMPAVDQRVLVYRKLAAAEDLESVDEVQEETEAAHGELPLAGLNLFNRARIRIRGERLGLESVTLSGGRITFLGVDVPKKVAFEFKNRYGAVNFPKSRKLSVPYKAGAGAAAAWVAASTPTTAPARWPRRSCCCSSSVLATTTNWVDAANAPFGHSGFIERKACSGTSIRKTPLL